MQWSFSRMSKWPYIIFPEYIWINVACFSFIKCCFPLFLSYSKFEVSKLTFPVQMANKDDEEIKVFNFEENIPYDTLKDDNIPTF